MLSLLRWAVYLRSVQLSVVGQRVADATDSTAIPTSALLPYANW